MSVGDSTSRTTTSKVPEDVEARESREPQNSESEDGRDRLTEPERSGVAKRPPGRLPKR